MSKHHRSLFASACVVVLVLTTACGGSSDPQPSTTSVVPLRFGAFDALDQEELAACMQAAGFELGTNALGGFFGGSDPAAAEQLRTCAEGQGVAFPEGGPNGGGFPDGNQEELAACLEEAGIEFSGPGAGGPPGQPGSPGGPPRPLGSQGDLDPEVQEAIQACLGEGD